MNRVLVTGAKGFIGSRLCRLLLGNDYQLRAALRQQRRHNDLAVDEQVIIGDICLDTQWEGVLCDVGCVIHLAARVHVMKEMVADPLSAFRSVNVDGTINLARQAAAAGVKRFIFLSSVKVNGELTQPGHPFSENHIPAPQDSYGISKMEAEQGLRQIAKETGMEVVIIRPPLVYGPGVLANFESMMRWVDRGIPLPFGAINNKRSFIALDNLVDFILTCIVHPLAANQTFLVADGEDLSTTELLQRVGLALDKPARLIPVAASLLCFGAALIGKKEIAQRLCGSLQVDISKARELLGWTPPFGVNEGLSWAAAGRKECGKNYTTIENIDEHETSV